MTTDCTPRYCYADPYEGGKQAIAEAYRNLCAVGAKPLAVTNCLNFGNPQRPEIMAQIVGCLKGMSEACIALDMPIVSGNVSLYNESKATGGGSAILPTPAIGAVGILDDWEKSATIAFGLGEGQFIIIGGHGTLLGQSVYLREIHGMSAGNPPAVDLERERRHGEFIRSLIARGLVTAVHDVSDGGILVALAEMALAGNIGFEVPSIDPEEAFGEDQGRYIVACTTDNGAIIRREAEELGIAYAHGTWTGTDFVHFDNGWSIPLATLRAAHEGFFPALMDGEL